MDDRPGELDRAAPETEARGSEQGCPVRIYPLRRPQGHTPPVPRYSAVLPQQDKVAVLFTGVQATDAAALRDGAFDDLLKAAGDAAPVYADFATFTDPQNYLNRVAALYWLKAADFTAWSKRPDVAEWRARVARLSSVGLWWEPVAVDADYMETIAFKEFLRGFSGCPVGFAGNVHWGARRGRRPASPRSASSDSRSRRRKPAAAVDPRRSGRSPRKRLSRDDRRGHLGARRRIATDVL